MRFRFDPLITKQALKGVVRLKKNLREQTRKAVEKRRQKMGKRLSKAEKKNAKTMATVAAVYTTSSIYWIFHKS